MLFVKATLASPANVGWSGMLVKKMLEWFLNMLICSVLITLQLFREKIPKLIAVVEANKPLILNSVHQVVLNCLQLVGGRLLYWRPELRTVI